MNPQMKQRIDEKLDQLSDQHGAQILDFAEFLASKESRRSVKSDLNEWSSAADEDAYRDL